MPNFAVVVIIAAVFVTLQYSCWLPISYRCFRNRSHLSNKLTRIPFRHATLFALCLSLSLFHSLASLISRKCFIYIFLSLFSWRWNANAFIVGTLYIVTVVATDRIAELRPKTRSSIWFLLYFFFHSNSDLYLYLNLHLLSLSPIFYWNLFISTFAVCSQFLALWDFLQSKLSQCLPYWFYFDLYFPYFWQYSKRQRWKRLKEKKLNMLSLPVQKQPICPRSTITNAPNWKNMINQNSKNMTNLKNQRR